MSSFINQKKSWDSRIKVLDSYSIFLHLMFCIVNVSFCTLTNSGEESSAVWCAVTLSNLIIYALTGRDIRSLSCFSKLAAFKTDWRKCISPSHLCALLQSNWILKRLLKRGELNLKVSIFFVKMTGVETVPSKVIDANSSYLCALL